jgi:hypothetical protein
MLDPQHLTNLEVSMACYSGNFIFFLQFLIVHMRIAEPTIIDSFLGKFRNMEVADEIKHLILITVLHLTTTTVLDIIHRPIFI